MKVIRIHKPGKPGVFGDCTSPKLARRVSFNYQPSKVYPNLSMARQAVGVL